LHGFNGGDGTVSASEKATPETASIPYPQWYFGRYISCLSRIIRTLFALLLPGAGLCSNCCCCCCYYCLSIGARFRNLDVWVPLAWSADWTAHAAGAHHI